MDPRKYMIIDLDKDEKKMFVTKNVSYISDNNNNLWTVRFSSSPQFFNYNKNRLLCLTNPISIDLNEKGFYINNKHINNVSELLKFDDGKHCYYYAIYNNGFTENFKNDNVYITRTPINMNGGTTWDYLNKLAAETGLMTDDEENILALQYGIIDVKRDNVPLAQYLGDKTKLNKYKLPNTLYYPFGCNISQKKAVENALTNQVSIIQGPPGTGKTQTILNIIANLLLDNKNVLIVSNNNSAVENVAEKLEKEGLGFFVAKLGSVENKEVFIANQREYPTMNEWIVDDINNIKRQVTQALNDVSKGFEGQSNYALLKAEYDALIKETKYDSIHHSVANEYQWLSSKDSKSLMSMKLHYDSMTENNQKFSLWQKVVWCFRFGISAYKLLHSEHNTIINALETAYYTARKREIESELSSLEVLLSSIDIQAKTNELKSSSLKVLKHTIAKRFHGERMKFTIKSIKPNTKEFLNEYPVVLSTTYSAKACISKDMVFDYVIMDEASQVDIKTGALTLSCAMNIVIVGDDKQLPNVISRNEEHALNVIQTTYNIEDKYKATTHSFLQSCIEVFTDAPITLLREHYRCHPRIINFCNQRFYNSELIAMTSDNNEDDVLKVIKTVPGNHARGHFNQREIDVILQEIMPKFTTSDNVGIITPYRDQAIAINNALGMDIASTVHKFQGRECDTIILSMVDNTPTVFSDDPNLLNVAISRAKTKLYVVINGNAMPADSNLAQLISYIQYNNYEIKESKIHSVFDILYRQYTQERLAYESKSKKVSEYISENIIYDTLINAIKTLNINNLDILCHYPLSRLINDINALNAHEAAFVSNSLSHVDFLLYNTITKHPLMTIEVDGWKYHKQREVQITRDQLKDNILSKYGLKPHRISTTDTVNVNTMINIISPLLTPHN